MFNGLFGANIGIKGVLFSENKRSLVTSVRAILQRDDDAKRHRFNLQLIRDPKIIIGAQPQSVETERAGPFVIDKDDAHGFFGTFVDVELMAQMSAIVTELMAEWSKLVIPIFSERSPAQNDAERDALIAELETLYGAFIANDPTDSARRLRECFYWVAGNYTFHVECEVKRDKRIYRGDDWHFNLIPVSEDRLRSNVTLIQRASCQLVAANWQTVYAEYN